MRSQEETLQFLQNQRIVRMLALRKAARTKKHFRPAEICTTCGFRIRGPNHNKGHHHLTLNRQDIIQDRWRATVKAQALAEGRRILNS